MNSFGEPVSTADQVKDFVKNLIAMPAQQKTISGAVTSAAGISNKVNRSPAEELSLKLGGARSSESQTPGELDRRQTVSGLEAQVRAKDPTVLNSIHEQLAAGKISESDAKSILASGKSTQLASSVAHLPIGDALDVWKLATDVERGQIARALQKRINGYRSTEALKDTPEQAKAMNTRLAQVTPELSAAFSQGAQ